MKVVKGTLNSVQLIGRLGRDPEMRFTSTGAAICRLSVATNRTAGRDSDGSQEYATDWTIVEAWDRLAEHCNEYLYKGRRVLITGSLRTDSWEDRETKQRRYRTYVRADEVMFLDAPGGNGTMQGDSDTPESASQPDDIPEETDAEIPF
jgi:single-strand DNA-binding protein